MTDIVRDTIHAIKFGKIRMDKIHDNIMKQGYTELEASEILREAWERRITG